MQILKSMIFHGFWRAEDAVVFRVSGSSLFVEALSSTSEDKLLADPLRLVSVTPSHFRSSRRSSSSYQTFAVQFVFPKFVAVLEG